jgi:hypothetical protein
MYAINRQTHFKKRSDMGLVNGEECLWKMDALHNGKELYYIQSCLPLNTALRTSEVGPVLENTGFWNFVWY